MPISNEIHDVLIAGAGPVGLFLACELKLAGCSVLVLEQAHDPHSSLKQPPFGVRGLSVATMESFDRRGLLDEIKAYAAGRDTPGPGPRTTQGRRAGGHFAGIPFFHDRIDASRWTHRLPGPVSNVAADMASIEAVLTARAKAYGIGILQGCAVDGFEQSDEIVVVRAGRDAFRCRWLVGCDGARSAVRKAAGIGFTGTDPEFTGYSVQATLAGPGRLEPGRHYTPDGMYIFTPPGTIGMVDFDGGAFHRSAAITRAHIETVLRKISGSDITVTQLDRATTWTDRAFQATRYRKGRVLLAGDAAHIHAPLGGQGLNLGLGDAMNLGWKLAATIRGDAPAGLLDSYHRERHPVAADVLDWSRAQVALMRPSPSSRALEAIFRDLIETHDGATYFADRVWGVSLRHDLGGDHPLVGRSVPDFGLRDGARLGDLMRSGKGLLLDLHPGLPLHPVAEPWSRRISYVAGEAANSLGLHAVLVRPDGIVAWASDTRPDAAAAGQAMARWFGE